MKIAILCGAVMVLSAPLGLAQAAAEEFAPKPYGIDRYEHIWKQSPFVVETPVVQQSAGLEQRFALTGVATIGADPVIFLLDRQSLSRLIVTMVKEKNPQNIELISVDSNPDPKKASATIKLGAEQGILHYDPGALQTVAQGTDPSKGGAPPQNSAQNPSALGQSVAAAATPPAQTASPSSSPPVTTKIIRRRAINLNH